MQADLTIDQRKALLMGLGYRCFTYENPLGPYYYISKDIILPRPMWVMMFSEQDGFVDPEQAAWEAFILDMNFCFEVVIPLMEARGWRFTYENGWAAFTNSDQRMQMWRDDNPATAICLAVLQFMEAKK